LRDDEERKGPPSCRTEWQIEVNMHMGKGNFCYSTLNSNYRTAIKMGAKNLEGLSLGWAKQGQEWGRFEEKNL